MFYLTQKKRRSAPFLQIGATLIELLVAMAILGTLFTISLFSLRNLVPKADTSNVIDTFIAQLKQQQQKAMSGDTNGQSSAQPFGVHIDQTKYVLYAGTTYSAGNAANQEVPLVETIRLSTTFSGGNILFGKGSGEVQSFVNGSNTITVSDTVTNNSTVIEINSLGVITAVN